MTTHCYYEGQGGKLSRKNWGLISAIQWASTALTFATSTSHPDFAVINSFWIDTLVTYAPLHCFPPSSCSSFSHFILKLATNTDTYSAYLGISTLKLVILWF